MDLFELIQSRRFLGSEFLMWLWYKSEVYEGQFDIGKHEGCEVSLDDRITLEAVVVEKEQSTLKGGSPALTPEAREALRQGKVPTSAKLRIAIDGNEYLFSFKAGDYALAGMKIPALLSQEDDDKFYERMYLIETVEDLVSSLYGEFLGLRLSAQWSAVIVPAIALWIEDESVLLSQTDYASIVADAPPLMRSDRAIGVRSQQHDDATEVEEEDIDAVIKAVENTSDPDAVPEVEPPPAGDWLLETDMDDIHPELFSSPPSGSAASI